MKLQTKILSSVLLASCLTISLSAQMQPMQGQKMMMQQNGCSMKMGKSSHGFMRMLNKITLTQAQQTDVQKIMRESRKNMPSRYEAFTNDGFDKAKYIKMAQHQRENMIKSRAETIAQIYDILTAKQKAQLKVLMDLKEERMKEGPNFDQNCYGRR
ncbi:MAG: Spy/CpxP family protein refolding chaperone [Candidatus Marinarcus sp.]|uniref:Spy/CpxP family protein refolding chaperone n=1 Tax=Candidatus Marinarcus sp. TaxID=3100987 RepID=UPI003AFFDF75